MYLFAILMPVDHHTFTAMLARTAPQHHRSLNVLLLHLLLWLLAAAAC